MEAESNPHRIMGGIGADEEYWDYLEKGEFRLSQCAACKKWIWPAHWRCPCGSWDIEWVKVEPKGTVYTWTETFYKFDRVPERHDDVPYHTVLAEIPHAGKARVMGMLQGDPTGIRIGAPVHGVIQPPSPKSKGYATICWVLDR